MARLNLPNMHYASEQRVEVYAGLDDNETERYQREYLEEVENMSGIAQVLRSEGEQRGEQRGIQRGEAAILIRLMQYKSGPMAEQERQKIESADADTLLEWSERILTANRVEDIFQDG